MRKIPNIIRIGAIVSIAWFAAAALTPLTSVAIRNSSIDSTLIGSTTPSNGRFTSHQATSNSGATVSGGQGAYTQWNNTSQGETSFINQRGLSFGGFYWYNAANSGALGSPIMTLSNGGVLTADTFSATGGLMAAGVYPSSTGVANGAWLNWNQSGTFGETDFINQHATSTGGFNWYDTTSPTTVVPPIASLDSSGNFFARSVTTSAGLTGSLSGNASTASALASAPSNCGTTIPATGIQANGNANCGSYPFATSNPGFVTLPGGLIMQWGQTGTYDTGPVSVAFAHTFPHACLNATVGSIFTGASRTSSLVSCNTGSITIENNGSGVSNYTAIGW